MTQIEIDIDDLDKEEKKVWVKPTVNRKGHYRRVKGGEKEVSAGNVVGESYEDKWKARKDLRKKLINEGKYGKEYEGLMQSGSTLLFQNRSKPYNPVTNSDIETRDNIYIINRCAKMAKDASWGSDEIRNLKLDMISGDKSHMIKIIKREFKV